MPSTSPLSRRAIAAITLDLIADELSRSRGRSVAALGRDSWIEAARIDGAALDCDSLERLNLASALNEFFHLHEHGLEDHLLTLPTIGGWCDLIEQSLAASGTHLTFRTSGSTGEPQRCTHGIADLQAEADGWAGYFPDVAHVVALVPAHHIYGTIFAALLPDRIGAGCTVALAAGIDAVRRAGPGSLIVATPTHWQYLAPALPVFPPNLIGVTSTAPMPALLAHRLRDQGLERMVQVYGSSETAGIAVREHEEAPYALLDGWSAGDDDTLHRVLASGSPLVVTPPDRLRWMDDRRFIIEGRRDGAVQVGGINVHPSHVRDVLLAHTGVAEAAVRLEVETGRMKAFVVPAKKDADPDRLIDEIDRWCGERLTSVERPRRFAWGPALPVNAMGKPTDW